MTTPPPPIRVRRDAPAAVRRPPATPTRQPLPRRPATWEDDDDTTTFRTVLSRPQQTYKQGTNLFRPAPAGTPCCVSKCPWPADHLVTFHQTGGTTAYCDDHGWPFKPRRQFQ